MRFRGNTAVSGILAAFEGVGVQSRESVVAFQTADATGAFGLLGVRAVEQSGS